MPRTDCVQAYALHINILRIGHGYKKTYVTFWTLILGQSRNWNKSLNNHLIQSTYCTRNLDLTMALNADTEKTHILYVREIVY